MSPPHPLDPAFYRCYEVHFVKSRLSYSQGSISKDQKVPGSKKWLWRLWKSMLYLAAEVEGPPQLGQEAQSSPSVSGPFATLLSLSLER